MDRQNFVVRGGGVVLGFLAMKTLTIIAVMAVMAVNARGGVIEDLVRLVLPSAHKNELPQVPNPGPAPQAHKNELPNSGNGTSGAVRRTKFE